MDSPVIPMDKIDPSKLSRTGAEGLLREIVEKKCDWITRAEIRNGFGIGGAQVNKYLEELVRDGHLETRLAKPTVLEYRPDPVVVDDPMYLLAKLAKDVSEGVDAIVSSMSMACSGSSCFFRIQGILPSPLPLPCPLCGCLLVPQYPGIS